MAWEGVTEAYQGLVFERRKMFYEVGVQNVHFIVVDCCFSCVWRDFEWVPPDAPAADEH